MNIKTLYRPVGIKELVLISNSDWKRFPPRLEWQPIFYPVLNETYAAQIARDWNTNDECSGYCGVVTAFDIDEAYYETFQVQNVGGEIHNELWVPAEELNNFNNHIQGKIRCIAGFFGDKYTNPVDEKLAEILSILEKY
jgi:hypothetical protein